jgi:hypothetical protein
LYDNSSGSAGDLVAPVFLPSGPAWCSVAGTITAAMANLRATVYMASGGTLSISAGSYACKVGRIIAVKQDAAGNVIQGTACIDFTIDTPVRGYAGT